MRGRNVDRVTRDMCVAQLKNADDHPEKPELMRSAIVSSLIAVVDCQYATGIRVKRLVVWLALIGGVLLITLLFGSDVALRLINFIRGVG